MNKNGAQKVLGKGLFFAVLVAMAAFLLGRVESAHADNNSMRLGETVIDAIPLTGEKIRWYRFEASPGTLVRITMSRLSGNLVPYIALRAYNGQEQKYEFVAIDHNEDGSATAQVAALLPLTDNGYWIEAATVDGAGAGEYKLTLATDSIRQQQPAPEPQRQVVGYQVMLTIDKVIAYDLRDDDGTDEISLEYSLVEHAPTARVNPPAEKGEFPRQQGWSEVMLAPLTDKVSTNSRVTMPMWLKESGKTLGYSVPSLEQGDLARLASTGAAESYFFQPAAYDEDGGYTYEVWFSVRAKEIYGW